MDNNQEQYLNENLLRYSRVQAALESFQNLIMEEMKTQMKPLHKWLEGAKEVRPYTEKEEIWCPQYKGIKKHKHVDFIALFVRFSEGYLEPGLCLTIHETSERPITDAIEKYITGKPLKYAPHGAYRFDITPENRENIKDMEAIRDSFKLLIQTAADILEQSADK